MTRLLRHDQTIARETDGAVKFDDMIEELKKKKKKFDALQWSIEDWISILARGGGQKKRIQCCLNLDSSRHILCFRAIQGHSGLMLFIDLELQDHVLIPERFTEYIYRVGNVSEMSSIIRSGLIPGGQSQKRKTIRVLHDSEPDERWTLYGGNFMRLDKARDCSRQKELGNFIKILYIGAMWNSLKREDCYFTKQGRMQSASTTLFQLFASKRWCAWRRRMSYIKRYAWLQEYHGLYSNRIRKSAYKINVNRMQEHLMTNQADQRVLGRPGATPWITEFLVLNSKIHIAKTKSKGWLRSSRTTRTKKPSKTSSRHEGGQQVQREDEGVDRRHEQHRDLRALRNIFKTAIPWLQQMLGSRHCLLFVPKMLKDIAEWIGGRQEQQRCCVDTWPCYQEE